jgi:hypothetical protein
MALTGEMAQYVYVATQEEDLTGALRTSHNAVHPKFGEQIYADVG